MAWARVHQRLVRIARRTPALLAATRLVAIGERFSTTPPLSRLTGNAAVFLCAVIVRESGAIRFWKG